MRPLIARLRPRVAGAGAGGLAVDALTVAFGEAVALDAVALRAPRGRLTAVVGPNGAGKSTLLRAISGIAPVRSGTIAWAGRELAGASPHAIVQAGVAHVPEGRLLFPGFTVIDNLHAGAIAGGAEPEEHLEDVLGVFPHLRTLLKRQGRMLSGGEQQMVAIGRALMGAPRLLLVDELSLGLAPILSARLLEALADHAEADDVALLLVDQNLRLLQRRAHAFYILSRGQMSPERAPDDLGGVASIDAYVAAH